MGGRSSCREATESMVFNTNVITWATPKQWEERTESQTEGRAWGGQGGTDQEVEQYWGEVSGETTHSLLHPSQTQR